MHQVSGYAGTELIAYPLLFGGASLIIIALTKKYFLREKMSDFNSGKGTWINDILWGLGLTVIYFVLFFAERATLAELLQFRSNEELLGLMLDMREDPILLILFFGPVLWIGVALYEEVIRVFLLTQMWKWSSNLDWAIIVIIISSVIIGLAHWHQGPYGIVTIGIKSLVAGYFFYRKKRLMPLVYAHVLYDGLQMAALLLTYTE